MLQPFSLSILLLMSARIKDLMSAADYVSLVKTHIPMWTTNYNGRNEEWICTSYFDLVKALIQRTPRVSKVSLEVAAVKGFGVPYKDANMFACAIHLIFKGIITKARKVTSGTQQHEKVLELVKLYRSQWKEGGQADEEEVLEDEPNDPGEQAIVPAADEAPAPSWSAFTSRLKGLSERVGACVAHVRMQQHTCSCTSMSTSTHAISAHVHMHSQSRVACMPPVGAAASNAAADCSSGGNAAAGACFHEVVHRGSS